MVVVFLAVTVSDASHLASVEEDDDGEEEREQENDNDDDREENVYK